MGKIIFWIVVFFVVLLALRLVNLANQKARRDEGREAQRKRELPAEPTVRCVACGTYLPKADAKPVANGYRCPDPGCTGRR
jgi:hypothetical protein